MKSHISRRRFFTATAAVCSPSVFALPARKREPGALSVVQIADTSQAQQDVSKDFLVGARAFWQNVNARGGVKGRPVQHRTLEVDGTPGSISAALESLRTDADCVALFGTSGDQAAAAVVEQLGKKDLQLAHIAPWLQSSFGSVDDQTFPIFAGRQEQIEHAVRSMATVGFTEIGVVYASRAEWQSSKGEIERIGAALKLQLHSISPDDDLERLGATLPSQTAAVLLFVGGTPELLAFMNGLQKRQRQPYVVALADVNLQVISQLAGTRRTPLIATQPVPELRGGAPVVRAYRDTLARLFDEPPTHLSLAGFIAAKYTHDVLTEIEAPTRASVLAQARRRSARDLGGFRISYDNGRRSVGPVTQSMLTLDGRLIT